MAVHRQFHRDKRGDVPPSDIQFQRIQPRAFLFLSFHTPSFHEHPGVRSQVELKNEIFFQFLGRGLFSSCEVRMVADATECDWGSSVFISIHAIRRESLER